MQFAYTPKSNLEFWTTKFSENVARDRRTTAALKRLGWRVITVWECELGRPYKLRSRLTRLLAATERRQTRSGDLTEVVSPKRTAPEEGGESCRYKWLPSLHGHHSRLNRTLYMMRYTISYRTPLR